MYATVIVTRVVIRHSKLLRVASTLTLAEGILILALSGRLCQNYTYTLLLSNM